MSTLSSTQPYFLSLIGMLAIFIAAAAYATGVPRGRGVFRAVAALVLTAGWLLLLATAARSGWLSESGAFPPAILRLMGLTLLVTLGIALTPVGESLAASVRLRLLVAFQAFRFPLELMLADFHRAGKIPLEMTFHGWNYDIVTGLSALVVCWFAENDRFGARLAALWNWIGLALLFNVLRIAVAALPGPFHDSRYSTPNTLPLYWPGVWILFCVQMALLGHLLVVRKVGWFGRNVTTGRRDSGVEVRDSLSG
jgi:hypothetical protein